MNKESNARRAFVLMVSLAWLSCLSPGAPVDGQQSITGNPVRSRADSAVPQGAGPNLFVSSATSVFEYDGTTGALINAFSGQGNPRGLVFGPNGNLFAGNQSPDQVSEYDLTTGVIQAFVPGGSGGLLGPSGVTIGPNGNLFVASSWVVNNQVRCGICQVLEFNGPGVVNVLGGPGAFAGTFVTPFSGGLNGGSSPAGLVFGPDGDLFVSSTVTNEVLEYSGATGAFIRAFVSAGSGGLTTPAGLVFGPNGDLFVSSNETNQILEYDGTTGAFVKVFVPGGSGVVNLGPEGLVFGPNGDLFVAGGKTPSVVEYDGATGAFIQVFVPSVPGIPSFLVFSTVNTPAGFNISVTPQDSTTGSKPLTVNFAQVTRAGQTTLSSSSSGPALPPGYQLVSPTYYDVTTAATFTTATVCITDSSISAGSVLLHFNSAGNATDVTDSAHGYPNVASHVICSVALASLSPFAIATFQSSTSTTVASSANSSVFGQSVTFTATVSPASGSGTPTGTVSFNDGAVMLGTETLSGGQASFTTFSLSVGSHNITAVYGGDANFTGSASAALTQTVNKASTATALTSSTNPSTLNQSVTFTASVSVIAPGSGTPTGTITFQDGASLLGTVALSSSGSATFTTSSFSVGAHSVTASYTGDGNFTGSSGSLTQQVAYGIFALYDQTRSVHSGATFPIKVQLSDSNGNDVSSSTIVLHATAVTAVSGLSGPPASPGNASPDADFRFDITLGLTGGYIVNLKTSGLAPGTYSLLFMATGDPVMHSVDFGVN